MSRGTRAILRLESLRHNLGVARTLAPDSRMMVVVKANGYGHGLEPVVKALPEADGFAVATLCEAERVRKSDGDRPVLLLEGVTSMDELSAVAAMDLDLVVHSNLQLELLERRGFDDSPLRIWLKIDTGMHRLGFDYERAESVLERVQSIHGISPDAVLMSHLANADDPEDGKTRRQIERFGSLAKTLGLSQRSLANSAGLVAWPESHHDWVRTGLAIYGESPVRGRSAAELGLKPCMTLRSTLIAVNYCHAGASLGYGSSYRCPTEMPVGVVAIGYGDGYPRHADSGTSTLVNGVRCPLVGRVSMDMLTVDLRNQPDARVGDPVVLWGEGLPVEEVATSAETIPYELMCGVTARVTTEYV